MPPSSPEMGRRRLLLLIIAAGAVPLLSAHGDSCPFSTPAAPEDHHHHHHEDHDHHHHHDDHDHDGEIRRMKLPEELAEEEDLELHGFDHHHHHHHHTHGDYDLEPAPIGIWVRAMGCSLLVSMASLICLTILPLVFVQGKPSKTVVDSLALFGAGAMLGDAFLHQLPHAFGGEHSHSHEHHTSSLHDQHLEHEHSHAHSLKDLSVGLSVLCGIVLFFLVEKVVRYVEGNSVDGTHELGHGHHHHKRHNKLKDDDEKKGKSSSKLPAPDGRDKLDIASKSKLGDDQSDGCLNGEKCGEQENLLRKRMTSSGATDDRKDVNAQNGPATNRSSLSETTPSPPPSSLVFGYLNLFSDGVHNFTDGIALGSAFLLYGSVGGWSRTFFLLAHELPQEVGDFGILVRSGFSVSKALFFNFLSALMALAGTALALALGKDPGQSSWIEGFTAGGFIYIAVAGVVPEMHDGKTTFKSTALQLTSLSLGMAVALYISLVE